MGRLDEVLESSVALRVRDDFRNDISQYTTDGRCTWGTNPGQTQKQHQLGFVLTVRIFSPTAHSGRSSLEGRSDVAP